MINEKNAKVLSVILSIGVAIATVTWTVSGKADKSSVTAIAEAIGEKADKKEVESLREYFYELSAKRREDSVRLDNILSAIKDVNVKMADVQKDQKWQIEQELKRLQWQSFKSEPQATPPPNVNR